MGWGCMHVKGGLVKGLSVGSNEVESANTRETEFVTSFRSAPSPYSFPGGPVPIGQECLPPGHYPHIRAGGFFHFSVL